MLDITRDKAQAEVQDAEASQRLLEIAARADVFEAIRQGLDDAANGRMHPARKVLDDLRHKRCPRPRIHLRRDPCC
jgi:hypothetical protein